MRPKDGSTSVLAKFTMLTTVFAPDSCSARYLTRKVCEDTGLMPISENESMIVIGAMNSSFPLAAKVLENIRTETKKALVVEQVTANDWEKWFEESLNVSTLVPDEQFTVRAEDKRTEGPSLSPPEPASSLSENPQHNQLPPAESSRLETDSPSETIEDLFADDNVDFEEVDESAIEESELQFNTDPVVNAVASILFKCLESKASDIHVEPLETRMRVRYRTDGMLQELYSLPKAKANAITSRLKIMSKLDIAERRLPQDGRIRCKLQGKTCDFRVSTLPGKWGEKVVLRMLQSDSSILDLGKLVNSPRELKLIREMGSSPYGILIVVGPTGSGKSTTLYSILSERNTSDVNISTVEDPVEYTLDGIHQVQVIREKGLDFARALRALMRQDPDIILVGETRDRETAQTAMEAALTGHMVFTTLHANDTATAITRLSEMGVPPYLVGASVIGVMAQRLVRKVCPECSSTRSVDPQKDSLAIQYGVEQVREATVVVGHGNHDAAQGICDTCKGTGYKGRLGLYEVMKVNESTRDLIMRNATADVIRQNAIDSGVKTLLQYGMELVRQQLTTVEEVERVCLLEESSDD